MGTLASCPAAYNMFIFRYLQGYMGTGIFVPGPVVDPGFRYLQGYMGTLIAFHQLLSMAYLDTFKDIWGLARCWLCY